MGKPVIATRITGLPEAVIDGETGFLVAPGDIGALAAKLRLLLSDPGLRERMGKAGREFAGRRFSPSALGDGARLAFYIGASEQVAGVRTEMVAWANDDVFIQVWIGADDQLPRRLRAVYRTDPLRLRHDMLLSNWQLDPVLAAEAFDAGKALGAQKIAFSAPVAPPPGVKPLVKGKPVSSSDKAR